MPDENLDELCQKLELLKKREGFVQEQLKAIRDLILLKLEEADATSLTTPEGRQVTRVQSESRQWDLGALRDLLSPLGLWEEVRVLIEDFDREKLDHLVQAGRVSERQLASAFEVRPNQSYPRITKKRRAPSSSR